MLVPPFVFSLAALTLLVYAGLEHVPVIAVALAGAAVLAAMARTVLTLREIRGFHEARRLAATDELTDLPNRREFGIQLHSHLALARERGEPLALLIIDLDRFKDLNDALGHHAGDRVLAQIGPRLRTILRADDVLARLGGDEFAVLLPGARSAADIGRRIARTLEDRFPVEGIDVQVAASVGIAVFPEHGEDAASLLQHADVAMYQAKVSRSGHAFYAQEQDRNTRAQLELIGQLRDAVDLGQLVVHYQPLVDLEHRRRHRRGGARPLAAPRTRAARAGRVHPAGRADRHHAEAHRSRTRDRAVPGRVLAAAKDSTSALRSTSRPRPCSSRRGPRR